MPKRAPIHARLAPPFWRHDFYTLRRLRQRIETAIARHLKGLENGVIVDIGAGEAPYAPLLESLGHRYVRCDLEGDVESLITPGQPIPLPDDLADAVVSFQVLEHVRDLDWYLGECRRLIHNEEKLVLSTHGNWLYHLHPTDFRRWTRDGLQKELEIRGFKVVETLAYLGPLAWTTQFRALGYHQIARRLGPLGVVLNAVLCAVLNARMVVEDFLTPASIRGTNAAIYVMVAVKAAPPL